MWGGGGNCSMSFRLDIFGDYHGKLQDMPEHLPKNSRGGPFCIIFHVFNHRVTSYSQAISVTSTV